MKKFLSFVLFISILSCNSQKEIYVDNPQTISFGSTGGFTNESTVFKLHSNGELWIFKSFKSDSSMVVQLRKNQTRKLFEQFYQIGLDTLELKNPGNMSSFIQIMSKTCENKIIWPKGDQQVQPEISDLYKELFSYTQIK